MYGLLLFIEIIIYICRVHTLILKLRLKSLCAQNSFFSKIGAWFSDVEPILIMASTRHLAELFIFQKTFNKQKIKVVNVHLA